jgi:hypothetical protein
VRYQATLEIVAAHRHAAHEAFRAEALRAIREMKSAISEVTATARRPWRNRCWHWSSDSCLTSSGRLGVFAFVRTNPQDGPRQSPGRHSSTPVLTIRAMSDGKGYASRYLAPSDYYAEGERGAGQRKGRGAEVLGLSGRFKRRTSKRSVRAQTRPVASFSGNATAPTASTRTERLSDKAGTFMTSRSPHPSRSPLWPWEATNG